MPYNNEWIVFKEVLKEALMGGGDVLTIDQVIGFMDSSEGVKIFGEKKAQELAAAAKKAKEQGEDTCICPACQAGKAILANQAVIG